MGVVMGAGGVAVGARMMFKIAVPGTWEAFFTFADHNRNKKDANITEANKIAPRSTLKFSHVLSNLIIIDLCGHQEECQAQDDINR